MREELNLSRCEAPMNMALAFATFKTCLKPSPLTVVLINAAIVPDLTAAKINKRYSIRLSINRAKESPLFKPSDLITPE